MVVLKYFDGLKSAEIAKRLGTTPNAVSSRLSRARQKLRIDLDEHQPDGSSSANWAFIALGMGYPSLVPVAATAAPSIVPNSTAALTPTSTWLLSLAMKKIIATAAALALLLVGGFWLTAVSPETREVGATAPSAAAAEFPDEVDDLVIVDLVSQRAELPAAGAPVLVPEPSEPEPIEAAKIGTGSVLVKVISDDTELPVKGVAVSLENMSSHRWFDSQTGTTDERGELLLTGLRIAPTGVTAWRTGPGGENAPRARAEIRAGETGEVTIRIADGDTIRGQVVDGVDRGVAGAEIWLSEGNGLPFTSHFAGYADEQGRFEIQYAIGFQAVGARAPGVEPSVQEVPLMEVNRPKDPEVGVKLVLKGLGGTLRGRVVEPSGNPVVRALVRIEGAGPPLAGFSIQRDEGFVYAPAGLMVQTDADGAFQPKPPSPFWTSATRATAPSSRASRQPRSNRSFLLVPVRAGRLGVSRIRT